MPLITTIAAALGLALILGFLAAGENELAQGMTRYVFDQLDIPDSGERPAP